MAEDTVSFTGKLRSIKFDTYDIRMAVGLCTFLSLVLWWIPVIGPAVAGYVAGRKTGSMTKGTLCSFAVGSVIVLIAWGLAKLILPAGGFPDVPASEAAANMSGLSSAVGMYLAAFFTDGTSSLALSQLGILIVFGLVGGMLSRQVRKETAELLATGAVEGAIRPTARSVELYSKHKTLGFQSYDDCIASQKVNVNDNPESYRSEPPSGASRRSSGSSTVHTVTTTVSPSSTSADEEEDESPFSDILDKSERKKGPY